MAVTVKPLTATQVAKTNPGEKPIDLADGQGLFIRIRPTGQRSWVFRYKRPGTGKTTNWVFGEYPGLSIEEARGKRAIFRRQVSEGLDPQAEQQAMIAERARTFADVVAEWLPVKATTVSADYLDDVTRNLELHVLPRVGGLSIQRMTPPPVISALRPLEAAGKLETLRRAVQRINEVMVYAVNCGYTDSNTLRDIGAAFGARDPETNPAIDPAELPSLLARIQSASIRQSTRNLIMLQLHTMTRPAEAAHAEWAEFDLDAALWTIPAARMKSSKAHIVPLTGPVIALLQAQSEISGNGKHVFPGDRKPQEPTNKQTANAALKRMGYRGTQTAHGLRTLASDCCVDVGGFDQSIVDRCLSHVEGSDVSKSFKHYTRATYLEQRTKVHRWWSDHIVDALVTGVTQSAKRGLRAVA